MSRRRTRAALALPSLLVPTLAASQTTTSLGAFAALPLASSNTSGVAVGVEGTASSGILALRGGAGTTLGSTSSASSAGFGDTGQGMHAQGWLADADVLLLPQALGARRTTPMFYALAGLGAASAGSGAATTTNWSFGAGVLVPLGTVDVTAETRTRTALGGSAFDGSAGRWQEMRVGLALRFGAASGSGARGRSGSIPSRIPTRSRVPNAPNGGIGSASARRALSTADRYLGVPYKWGGSTPAGFDCSGFVQYVFAEQSVQLPRTSREQARVGMALATSWNAVAPGDLVMFAEPGEAISHVAIYAGNRRIIHASSSGGGVRYDDLDTRRGQWYLERMVAARRVTGEGTALVHALMAQLHRGTRGNGVFDPPDRAPAPR